MHVLTRNFELVVLIQQWVERVNESEERKNEGSDRLKPQGMLCYE